MTQAGDTLDRQIGIRAAFSRSIHLSRDSHSLDLLRTYVPTSRAILALEQIAGGLSPEPVGRALALIGPYGSGKSAFALFLGALLSRPDSIAHCTAFETLHKVQPQLAERFHSAIRAPQGFLRVPITGIPDSLVRQLMLGLSVAAEQGGLAATLVTDLRESARPGTRMDTVLDLIAQTQVAWTRLGGAGVLIEIDELGKFLEYESYHPQHREIHLLQLLAEKAGAGGPAPLHLVVLLHQAFEHYSARLGKSLRDEWKKVQGRFGAIAFLEPAEQALRVVAAAFERQGELSREVEKRLARRPA